MYQGELQSHYKTITCHTWFLVKIIIIRILNILNKMRNIKFKKTHGGTNRNIFANSNSGNLKS